MIVYFADRKMNILGQASTELIGGLTVTDDLKTEEIETGVAIFECKIHFDKDTRDLVKACAEVGNYILRSHDNENEFYTIIDIEENTKKQTIYIYAEDAGLDLLNEVVGEYEADKAYSINHYIEKFAYDSGFQIGINEAAGLTRKLSWDGEQTVTARLASVATQFDGCEISYSFDIKGLLITKKYINIYKQRGKDIGITLRLNRDIDSIVTSKSIANLATALRCTGGTLEGKDDPITLRGYKYDDGDFYVDGDALKSREAVKKWSRYIWSGEQNLKEGHEGHIVKPYSYDTTEQATLCAHAITELKKAREIEVNYEVDITKLPDNTKIGDRVNIVDEAGKLYLSSRILKLATSATDKSNTAVIGEHLIKNSGISQKVAALAEQFAKNAKSAAKALSIATNAKSVADAAQAQADSALAGANTAQQLANDAQTAANTAQASAAEAQTKANNAQAAVDSVEESVASLNSTITKAQEAAENAQKAADTADDEAKKAAQAAAQALADAAEASAAVEVAQSAAETATTKADEAKTTADAAKAEAETAQATADAAKLDAEKAQEDIDSLGENLETVSQTMQADYARKTDLTEATASLQTQITQNAAEISSTASRVQTIDETANNAKEQAEAAQATAAAAQSQADQASADAQAAQTAANNAAQAATNAQSEADNAKAAAATAQDVADKAKADLEAAQADLATVSGRVDATEDDIAAAQQAVTAAQAAADKADADAEAAAKKATEAQSTADKAVTDASTAQAAANDAASKAAMAQQAADEANGNAATAQAKADEAATAAANAQETADTAKTNAATAQAKAEQAATNAANAQKAADDADAKAAQAAADLATAQQNLADVTSRVDATEEEVAAAQEAVQTAQAAADKAKADAATAQSTADTAKANAATAQAAANNAKTAADNAQAAADAAQDAADEAKAAADALAVRVTSAETKITQNSDAIALRATKTEVTAATKEAIDSLEIGGRNLLLDSGVEVANNDYRIIAYEPSSFLVAGEKYTISICFTPATGLQELKVFLSLGNKWLASVYPSGTEKQIHKYTFTAGYAAGYTPAEGSDYGKICIYRTPNDASVTENTTIHWVKVEKGNKATDWTPAPEDMASVADMETAMLVNADSIVQTVSASYASKGELAAAQKDMQDTADKINDEVSKLSKQVSLALTAEGVQILVEKELQNGAGKVATGNGYTFNEDGLTVSDSNSNLTTQITEDGMKVVAKNEDGNTTTMLTANSVGVDAQNLHATTYLIVGKNSRFEDYGESRTGCFWIGG